MHPSSVANLTPYPPCVLLFRPQPPFIIQSIELLYLRAICYHALGYARKAVADYEACMGAPLRPELEGPLAEEAR